MLAIAEPRHPQVSPENKLNTNFDPMADKRMWTSVILQAVQDAITDAHAAEWTTPQRDAHDAIKWLLYPNSEMTKVCSLAGCMGDRIRASARVKLAPLAAVYEAKALSWDEVAVQRGDNSVEGVKEARKIAERYRATAALIRAGL